jgi:hypothetical protein
MRRTVQLCCCWSVPGQAAPFAASALINRPRQPPPAPPTPRPPSPPSPRAQVAAFLSPLHPGFDATLMFVMGGALVVATPLFQWARRRASSSAAGGSGGAAGGGPTRPLCCERFADPAATAVDGRLLLGGALFGAGWGLSGICPGCVGAWGGGKGGSALPGFA